MSGFIVYALGVVLVAAVGAALYVLLRTNPGNLFRSSDDRDFSITKTEWIVGVVIASLVVLPLVTLLGGKIAKDNVVSYNEYWSALEARADINVTNCSKDGPCVHEYDCDPYIVMVTKYRTESYTTTESDGKGGMRTVTKTRQVPYQVPETRYHDCPYVEQEFSYTVTDTMDETYTLGSHWFPDNPEDNRWTGYGWERRGMPNVSTGKPAYWVAAKARLDAGNPGGTTSRHSYKNYILASQEDIYAKASGAIDKYKAEGLLPKIQTKVYGEYLADKAYFAGITMSDTKLWQEAVQRFNGHLGSDRQGDLHVVFVDSSKVVDPDEYSQALAAYWQSDALGKDSLSKNGIGLVLGIDGSTVAWSRGFTGMPLGNENLVVALQGLADTAATPEALFDTEAGAVTSIVFEDGAGFERVEMADYEYLYDSIQISGWAKFWIFLVGLILSMGVWGALLAVDLRFHPFENLFSKNSLD